MKYGANRRKNACLGNTTATVTSYPGQDVKNSDRVLARLIPSSDCYAKVMIFILIFVPVFAVALVADVMIAFRS